MLANLTKEKTKSAYTAEDFIPRTREEIRKARDEKNAAHIKAFQQSLNALADKNQHGRHSKQTCN